MIQLELGLFKVNFSTLVHNINIMLASS